MTGNLPQAQETSSNGAVQLPDDVAVFCRRKGLLTYVPMATDLVTTCFGLHEMSFEIEIDPETGEDWLVIHVEVRGNRHDVLAAYRNYSRQWVRSVPWPERNLICLSYNIL
jgi:hypothetical protein